MLSHEARHLSKEVRALHARHQRLLEASEPFSQAGFYRKLHTPLLILRGDFYPQRVAELRAAREEG